MRKVLSHPIPRFFFVNAMCSILMMVSCQEDSPKVLPSVIQFSANLQNVVEGEEATILLTLDRPAPGNGSVEFTIETNAVYSQHFETDPAVSNNTIVLQIEKGEKSAEFKITTVDSDKYEGTRFIIFQLKSKSDGLRVGDITALTLTIGDDEGPSMANFAASSAILNETGGDSILVDIPFSSPANGEGSLTVTMHAGMAIIDKNFTIDQEVTDYSFSFNVVRNTTGVSFKVFPIDNDLFTGDFPIAFTITDVSGVVQKGDIAKYTLKIRDDEAPSLATFAFPSGTVAETDAEGIVVDVSLSSPVKGEGTIVIAFPLGKFVYGRDFTTLPEANNDRITLDFSHDQTSGSFKVIPSNDELLHGTRTLLFSIAQTTGVLRRGDDALDYVLTFIDDEEPSVATFAVNTATIDETNTRGMEVQILFSHPVPGTGTITLEVEGSIDRYLTKPPVQQISYSYYISLYVALHATSVSFSIMPVNDSRCNVFSGISFAIASVEGAIVKEGTSRFELTITDDEDPMLVTLAQKEDTLNENNTGGKEIVLSFSKPALQDGTIWVNLNYYNQYYSERYTTVPKMQYYSSDGDYASLLFKKGDNGVALKIFPVNDNVAKEDFNEEFHISYDGNDCVQIVDRTYTLTVVDDD